MSYCKDASIIDIVNRIRWYGENTELYRKETLITLKIFKSNWFSCSNGYGGPCNNKENCIKSIIFNVKEGNQHPWFFLSVLKSLPYVEVALLNETQYLCDVEDDKMFRQFSDKTNMLNIANCEAEGRRLCPYLRLVKERNQQEKTPVKLTCFTTSDNYVADTECSICLGEVNKPYITGNCGHSYCSCILRTLTADGKCKCPLCRANISVLTFTHFSHFESFRLASRLTIG
jgi:hypothetical protein